MQARTSRDERLYRFRELIYYGRYLESYTMVRESRHKILKELIHTLYISGHVRVLLPILESMASEFRPLLFSRDRDMQKNSTKLLASAIEAHSKLEEYDSVLWLTKFVRESTSNETSDLKSLISYVVFENILIVSLNDSL